LRHVLPLLPWHTPAFGVETIELEPRRFENLEDTLDACDVDLARGSSEPAQRKAEGVVIVVRLVEHRLQRADVELRDHHSKHQHQRLQHLGPPPAEVRLVLAESSEQWCEVLAPSSSLQAPEEDARNTVPRFGEQPMLGTFYARWYEARRIGVEAAAIARPTVRAAGARRFPIDRLNPGGEGDANGSSRQRAIAFVRGHGLRALARCREITANGWYVREAVRTASCHGRSAHREMRK
jgi:hypothetical protein